MTTDTQSRYFSFGDFRLDLRSGELRKNGREIRLQPQPAKLLLLLASRPGEVVTRGEIQKALWGDETFVDFEHGINFSIKHIRDALGDTTKKPRYIETVPRVGYRFLSPNASDKFKESDRVFPPLSHRRWLIGGVSLAVLVIGLILWFRPLPPMEVARQPRFQLTLPRGVRLVFASHSSLAVSPDGTRVAFMACGDVCQLFLRDRSDIDARVLPGTEGADGPFFSPDGQWLGFSANGMLKKIDLEHDNIVTLADCSTLRGASWGEDGTIIFSTGSRGLLRIAAEGGEVREVTKLEAGEYDHRWPHVLPQGRVALFEVLHEQGSRIYGSAGHSVAVVNLETGARRILIEAAGCPKFVNGRVLFGRDGVLYAAPLDAERLELRNPPLPVLEDVAMWSSPSVRETTSGVVNYDLARDGTLLFSPHEARLPRRVLVTLDRTGAREMVSALPRAYYQPHFSPDGRRVAATVRTDVNTEETFVLEIGSGAWTRVDAGMSTNDRSRPSQVAAGWMPDSERLLIGVDRDLFVVDVDSGEPTLRVPMPDIATDLEVSPDGSILLLDVAPHVGDWDIWRTPLTGESASEPWLATADEESVATFAPDGQWVAYGSRDSGRWEIYARPYTGSAVRHRVSADGGYFPQWSRDGREIFFRKGRALWSSRVRISPTFSAEPPQKLFDYPDDISLLDDYDDSPDGQRFIMVQVDPLELRPYDLVIVPGWVEEMKARLAAAN